MDTEDWAIGTVLILMVYGELGMWRLGTSKGERSGDMSHGLYTTVGPTGRISEYIDPSYVMESC